VEVMGIEPMSALCIVCDTTCVVLVNTNIIVQKLTTYIRLFVYIWTTKRKPYTYGLFG